MNTSQETTSLQSTVKSNSRAVADTVHRGIDRAAQALHETADNAAISAVRLAQNADRGADALRATEKQARKTLLTYSRHHPWRVLAIGLGVGFVMAKLTGRRVSE
jgi:ElaB/YqjD/DUF883 family membrane-anchored ribosome-binding protein